MTEIIKAALEADALHVALACILVLVVVLAGAWRFYAHRAGPAAAEPGMPASEVEHVVRTLAQALVTVIFHIKHGDFDAAEQAVQDWRETRDAKRR